MVDALCESSYFLSGLRGWTLRYDERCGADAAGIEVRSC